MPPLLDNEALLARLVGFDTTSHQSNLPLVDFLCDYLDRPGLKIHRQAAPDEPKANLVVEVGPPTQPEGRAGLVLSGHMDVVPALEPEWTTDPFQLTPTADGEHLAGRGSSDMKGFLALATNLAVELAGRSLRAPLVLVYTYDEEVGTLGAHHFRQTWPVADHPLPRRAIIGEPTELAVIRRHKGHLKVRLTLHGRSAHSGYPHLGVNAIEPAGPLLVALTELRKELEGLRVESSCHFPEVPFPSLNLATVHGGSAVNIVPDQCQIQLGVRLLPGVEPEGILERIRGAIRRAAPRPEPELEILSISPPMELADGSTLADDLTALAGTPTETSVSFATDAGWFQEMEMECVLYGPGSIRVAHRPNEFVPRADLVTADQVLRQFALAECCAP